MKLVINENGVVKTVKIKDAIKILEIKNEKIRIEKEKQKQRAYYAEHQRQKIELQRSYYDRHKEEIAEKSRKKRCLEKIKGETGNV